VAVSDDAGATSKTITKYPANMTLHRVATSARIHRNMVVASRQRAFDPETKGTRPVTAPWQYTHDGGETWNACAGLPASSAITGSGVYYWQNPLDADRGNAATFYVYGKSDGKIYGSTDGGENFSWRNTRQDQRLPTFRSYQMKTRPGAPNDLWIRFGQDCATFHSPTRSPKADLYHSTDGGVTWTRLSA
jgi:hypothetical protein